MMTKSIWLCTGFLAFTACSHDSKRDNPLDPVLTPPVELQVAIDDTAGTTTLSWAPYEGEAPFAAYWVLRKVQGLHTVETLAVVQNVGQVAFVDSSIVQNTTYLYRVSVVNAIGFEVPSTPETALPIRHPGVEIRADFESTAASVSLAWTPYVGTSFAAYRVVRRTQTQAPQTVAEIADRLDTVHVDRGLLGNTEYFYGVEVLTQNGETVPGTNELSGRFHELVDTWPLDIPDESLVRLISRSEGVAAQVTTFVDLDFIPETLIRIVEIVEFDGSGSIVGVREVLRNEFYAYLEGYHQGAVSIDEEGIGALLLVELAGGFGSTTYATGLYGIQDGTLVSDHAPDVFSDSELSSISDREGFHDQVGTAISLGSVGEFASFDNVRVYDREELVYEETFDTGQPEDWSEWSRQENSGDPDAEFDGGEFRIFGYGNFSRAIPVADTISANFRIELEAAGNPSIGVGPQIRAATDEPQAGLIIRIRPTVTSFHYFPYTEGQVSGFDVVDIFYKADNRHLDFPFGVKLGVQEGKLIVDAPANRITPVWEENATEGHPWVSVVTVDGQNLVALGNQIRVTTSSGARIDVFADDAINTAISDLRTWASPEGNEDSPTYRPTAICAPDQHQVFLGQLQGGRVPSFVVLNGRSVIGLSTALGSENGNFLFPLSADGSPDGRVYVLDAGNGRIQVFTDAGEYLTQWGTRGSAAVTCPHLCIHIQS